MILQQYWVKNPGESDILFIQKYCVYDSTHPVKHIRQYRPSAEAADLRTCIYSEYVALQSNRYSFGPEFRSQGLTSDVSGLVHSVANPSPHFRVRPCDTQWLTPRTTLQLWWWDIPARRLSSVHVLQHSGYCHTASAATIALNLAAINTLYEKCLGSPWP